MNSTELQERIRSLADFEAKNEAEWIERVKSEPTDVISGAIYQWIDGGGISNSRTQANRREAASAILQARSTDQITSTMTKLDSSTRKLTWVGIFLAFIGAIYALQQIVGTGT